MKLDESKNMSRCNNDVAKQVMWNRMISVVEEQAQALIRTAFSTSVREAGDLSAGVYDLQGHMLTQAVTGTPGHVNAMAEAVAHFIRVIGQDNIFEGDVYITNDPWLGTGHLHDITVVSPSFYKDKLVGFFACTAHVVDIGGRGFGADAASIYEEGLYIPIMKFAERCKVDMSFINLVRNNVREPDQVVGDLHALATCNEIGHQRLLEMMEEFQLEDLADIADFILTNSRIATLEKIAALPRQQADGDMTIDGYDKPIELKVHLEVQADQVICDFSGSSGIDKKGINVPLVYTQAYACYALKCAIAPEIPNNAASLAPFVITAPENTIVNALHPAPVALRHVVGHMLPDAVYNALDKILPETVPAEGAGTLCNFQISVRPRTDQTAPEHARHAEVLTFNSGGSGARPTLDGMNATAFPSGVMTMPVEATEHTGPVIIWRKELRPDSGGVGKYRGGLGQFMEVSATQLVPHGERVLLEFPGGAGYGPAKERDKAIVLRDLARGYITEQVAKDQYGLDDDTIKALLKSVAKGEAT